MGLVLSVKTLLSNPHKAQQQVPWRHVSGNVENMSSRASERARQAEALVTKTDHLGWIPGTYMVEGENRHPQLPLDLHTCAVAQSSPTPQTHTTKK